ncbi:hypothetical protein LTR01_009051 [Friedmanniomyces endolithicus]|nr:hypothetical protein LTR01_009051 [Friedmanniomyces endolithicus]KAK0822868.1 hypothetical protein LTR73_008984 [Friedmanniomyces endolithicus]
MLGQKRAHEVPDYQTIPSKRSKSDSGRWRSWETSNHAGSPTQTMRNASNDTCTPEAGRTATIPLEDSRATPSRSIYFGFIHDALSANPSGLRSHEIFHWLRENRPEAFQERGEEKFRVSLQTTLSAQSNKKEPTIWKYKEGKSKGSGYIWRLPNVEQSAEGAATPHSPHDASEGSPNRDDIVASHEEVQAMASHSPHGLHPGPAPDTSVSTVLIPSRMSESDIPTARPEHDSDLPEAEFASAQKTHREGQSNMVVGPAPSTLEVEALAKEDTQRPPGVMSNASATDQETLFTSVSTHARKPNGNKTTAALHDAAIIADPECQSHRQGEACIFDNKQQLYFGRLVMQLRNLRHQREQLKQEVEGNRSALPDILGLKCKAEQMQSRAQELAQEAEEARQHADSAYQDLASAQEQAKKICSVEGELQQVEQELKEARSELRID